MTHAPALIAAAELAKRNSMTFPNESADYRRARHVLFIEEIELRRHIERVAEQRRVLPLGGEANGDYRFEGWSSTATCSARSASAPARCVRRC